VAAGSPSILADQQQVSAGTVKYTDSTGWKRKGKACSLQVAATQREAVFGIESSATHPGLVQLLGGKASGVFCTDRAGVYDRLPLSQRQLCWAHLKRDFVACQERGGISQEVGEAGLAICREVFDRWRQFKGRRLRRRDLQERIEPLKDRLHRLLQRGARSGAKPTAGLCRNLLQREAALWRFACVPGLEPTNNHAERMLRPAVIWRKESQGSQSQRGCRFVERMLSAIQTLRLQGRAVLDYLAESIAALREGRAPPVLIA
jgi:transposase